MYVAAVVLAADAAAMLLASATCYRLLAGRRQPKQLTCTLCGVAICGLAAAGLAVSATVLLAATWLDPGPVADLIGARRLPSPRWSPPSCSPQSSNSFGHVWVH